MNDHAAISDGGSGSMIRTFVAGTWGEASTWAGALDGLARSGATGRALAVRGDVSLNRHWQEEFDRAVADPAVAGLPWLFLMSDGRAPSGEWVDTGTFPDHPPRGDRFAPVAATAADPGVLAVDLDALRVVGVGDLAATMAAGWESGRGSLVTPLLRYSTTRERAAHAATRTLTAGASPRLSSFRPDPTISIVIRTQLNRARLLDRALRAVSALEPSIDEVLLVSDSDDVERAAAAAGVRAVVSAGGAIPSRTANLMAGLEAATSDYVWFVDDDDWPSPGGAGAIRAAVHSAARPVVVGASIVMEEKQSGAEATRRYDPKQWFRAFTGWNPLPNCSVVIPRRAALERTQTSPLRNDLGEDLALALLVVSRPAQQVVVTEETLAYVSIRPDGDNAVTATDRTDWLRDRSSVMSDIVADDAASTHALWALGEAVLNNVPFTAERPS